MEGVEVVDDRVLVGPGRPRRHSQAIGNPGDGGELQEETIGIELVDREEVGVGDEEVAAGVELGVESATVENGG